jgi:hypothetical protein
MCVQCGTLLALEADQKFEGDWRAYTARDPIWTIVLPSNSPRFVAETFGVDLLAGTPLGDPVVVNDFQGCYDKDGRSWVGRFRINCNPRVYVLAWTRKNSTWRVY